MISSAYVKSPAALLHRGFSGGSFRDLTRVAQLNPEMWTDLFLENRDYLLQETDGLIAHLAEYRTAIAEGDAERLRGLLEEGRRIKLNMQDRLLLSAVIKIILYYNCRDIALSIVISFA